MSREEELAGIVPLHSAAAQTEQEWNPGALRPQARRLHILVLDEEIPYPPDAGKRIRTWNLLRRLAQRHKVSLLCYGNQNDPSVASAEEVGIRVHLVPPPAAFNGSYLYLRLFANLLSVYPYSVDKHYSAEFEERAKNLLEREDIDLVQCEWTPYARFCGVAKNHPLLITAHNIESLIWARRSQHSRSLIHRLFFGWQAFKMKRFERRALSVAKVVTAVTPDDTRLMQSWSVRPVRLVENGVDLEHFRPALETGSLPELLFLASLDWFPNLDALDYLLKQIMPLVLSRRPEAKLRIVGRRASNELREQISALRWASLESDVSDVRPYLRKAAVVVVPLRIGGGSRIKILEALACGKAVVSTSIGAEGLAVISGRHLEIADQPFDFAEEILELLSSVEKRRELGQNGRKLVVERYGWDKIADSLESAWFEACTQGMHASLVPAVPESRGVFAS